MLTITTDRKAAQKIAEDIHDWRKANIPNYNATSWANENLSDEEYDKIHKHEMEDRWVVSIPHDDKGHKVDKKDRLDKLPEGWRTEKPMGVTI